MKWFKIHLNWTVIFAWGAAELLLIPFIAFMAFVIEPHMPEAVTNVIAWLVLAIILIASPLFVSGWALRRKDRNLWWLLILFVPFGVIVSLCLESRGVQQV